MSAFSAASRGAHRDPQAAATGRSTISRSRASGWQPSRTKGGSARSSVHAVDRNPQERSRWSAARRIVGRRQGWTIPASRYKHKRDIVIPLSPAAQEIVASSPFCRVAITFSP